MSTRARTLVSGGVCIALIALIVLLWPSGPPPRDPVPLDPSVAGAFDRGDNALWMRRHWIHGGVALDVPRLARELEALGVGRIYPFVGPMDATGWPGWRDGDRIRRYDPERAALFFRAMNERAPNVTVLPWTGGNLHQDVRLADASLRARFAEHAAQLVALGAHGVHLNIEPMPDGTDAFLVLLRDVRAAIGPDAIVSIAAYPPTTQLHLFDDVHWTLAFTREVCMIADELAVMAYDTALRSPGTYEHLVADWTRDLLLTLPPRADGGCDVRLGVPSYEDDEPYHDPGVESVEHALRGILYGLSRDRPPRPLDGVALYASWTTDEREWAIYDRLWRGREPSGGIVRDGH